MTLYLAWLVLAVVFAPWPVNALIVLAWLSGALAADRALVPAAAKAAAMARVEAAKYEREQWIGFFDGLPNGDFDWGKVRALVTTYGWDGDAWAEHIRRTDTHDYAEEDEAEG
jgi:hypothetical protein